MTNARSPMGCLPCYPRRRTTASWLPMTEPGPPKCEIPLVPTHPIAPAHYPHGRPNRSIAGPSPRSGGLPLTKISPPNHLPAQAGPFLCIH